MIPHAIAVLWTVMSVSGAAKRPMPCTGSHATDLVGMVASWVVLYVFARVTSAWWAFATYASGNTVIQLTFSLGTQALHSMFDLHRDANTGMIWNMDPFSMPRAFCTGTLCQGAAPHSTPQIDS